MIDQLLRIVGESEIDKVYDYAKSYSERKDVEDDNYVLKKLDNFFCRNERYRDKTFLNFKGKNHGIRAMS